jgi:hypothetical protein
MWEPVTEYSYSKEDSAGKTYAVYTTAEITAGKCNAAAIAADTCLTTPANTRVVKKPFNHVKGYGIADGKCLSVNGTGTAGAPVNGDKVMASTCNKENDITDNTGTITTSTSCGLQSFCHNSDNTIRLNNGAASAAQLCLTSDAFQANTAPSNT